MKSRILLQILLYVSLFVSVYTLMNTIKLPKKLVLVNRKNLKLNNMERVLKSNRRSELQQQNASRMLNFRRRVKGLIELSDYELTVGKLIGYTLTATILGGSLGYVLKNPVLIVLLGLISGSIPFLFFQREITLKIKKINDALPMALGNIIAQYMSEEDFVIAVEKKLKQLPLPISNYFSSFVTEVQLLNVDVIKALNELKNRIDNFYFKEFIELAIQTEIQGEKLKYTMLCIPEDMRCLAQVQEEFDLIRKKYNRDFLACVIFFPLNILILKVGYYRYYYLLTNTVIGKLGLVCIVGVIITCISLMLRYNRHINVEVD